MLEEIVHEVNGRAEVYLDCGVSSGSDAFKALALGAKMVCTMWFLEKAGLSDHIITCIYRYSLAALSFGD